MNLERPDNSAEIPPTETRSSAPRPTRRKLIQAGLAGAPVVLALKSTPVLAANCKLPSGFSVSGNISRNGGGICTSQLLGVSHWVGNATQEQKDRPFAPPYFNASRDSSITTFGQALAKGNDNIHAKIVAAFLSSESGSFLALDMVKDMWNLGVLGAGYHPDSSNPGIKWDETDVLGYLNYVLAS